MMHDLWQVTLLLILAGLVALVYLIQLPRRLATVYADWQAFQAWRRARHAAAPDGAPAEAAAQPGTSLATVPGGGDALLVAPDFAQTVRTLRARAPQGRALVPLGWSRYGDRADLTFADLHSETYALGIGGPTRHGKSRLAFQILRTLAAQLPPRQLQWCLFDLKEVDFGELAGKAHTWRLVTKADQIPAAVEALNAEIERRGQRLQAARVTDWTDYQGSDLPLLVVYVSELAVLRLVMGERKLDLWLNDLLGRAAGYGIRTLVDTQNFGTYSTHWREQIKTWIIGPMTGADQDKPNTGLPTKDILQAGAIPPSQLPPVKGLFTAIAGSKAVTLRTASMTNAERLHLIDSLPNAVKDFVESLMDARAECPVPAAPTTTTTAGGSTDMSVNTPAAAADLVVVMRGPTPEEREKILHLKAAGRTQSQIEQAVYGHTGGAAYRKVKQVLSDSAAEPAVTVTAAA